MLCALSGQTPEDPVVSSTGYLFERSLIEKYVEANGKCPITNEPLSQNDLTPIKTSRISKPRPSAATSIPSMLHLFQNEWDAVMLECFTLKQHLETCRQELAHALYQNDAACRVIARLMRERDAAKAALVTVQNQLTTAGVQATAAAAAAPTEEAEGMPEALKANLKKLSKDLSSQRKNRKNQQLPDLAATSDIQKFTQKGAHPVHKSSLPGITSLSLLNSLVLTGGVDKTAVLFNKDTGSKVTTLTGHTKRINAVALHPTEPVALTASSDKHARIYRCKGSSWMDASSTALESEVIRVHTGSVVSLSLHPSGGHFVTTSADSTWAFHDINTATCITQVKPEGTQPGYQCGQVHPDGLILATGTYDHLVKIWDVMSQSHVHTFRQHTAPISSIAFSENGYILATADEEGTVKLWDLRKLKDFHSLKVVEGASAPRYPTVLSFDSSGNYLSVACNNQLQVYHNFKDLSVVQQWKDAHDDTITAVGFGPNARYIATTSMDRNLKFFE